MKQRVPFYYNEFGCITSKCKDNCCIGGWEIDIDDETYERYNNMTGELKHKILDSITQNEDEEYCFKLCDGKCPMLDDNGLCEIHKNLGEDYLGVVCKQFPRYSELVLPVKKQQGLYCLKIVLLVWKLLPVMKNMNRVQNMTVHLHCRYSRQERLYLRY